MRSWKGNKEVVALPTSRERLARDDSIKEEITFDVHMCSHVIAAKHDAAVMGQNREAAGGQVGRKRNIAGYNASVAAIPRALYSGSPSGMIGGDRVSYLTCLLAPCGPPQHAGSIAVLPAFS